MTTYTYNQSATITEEDAIDLASKVAADLALMQRFHNQPSDKWIRLYLKELIIYLVYNCLSYVEYGFQRHSSWVKGAALRYDPKTVTSISTGDTPGIVDPRADTSGAEWGSFLRSNGCSNLAALKSSLPFERSLGGEPGTNGMTWTTDRTYIRKNVALERKVLG